MRGLATGKFSISVIGSEFGALKSKTNLSASHFRKSKRATTSGINTETADINLLYFYIQIWNMEVLEFYFW